jgi:elongation factor Ts
MQIKSSEIKKLRLQTGAGVMDCKMALKEALGNFEKALDILKRKGAAIAAKKAGHEAREGIIEAYVHANNKIGVLVEISCETDFVAKNPEFREMAHEIAMQIAASNPKYISPSDVPESELENERKVIYEMFKKEGKKKEIVEKIVEGKIKKFKEELSLLKQPLVKNPKKTVEELITEKIAKFGEKIEIRRFTRYEI